MAPHSIVAGRTQCDDSGSETVRGSRSSPTYASLNLDVLRATAVLLVVGFHLAKFFNWQSGHVHVTDFGLFGVMLFFVHTTLVLMFSLERQRAKVAGPLFLPFIVRRLFRIYPLSILVAIGVYLFRIPSDLSFGSMTLFHQTSFNLISNVLLIQNVTRQYANPGPLWSLPLEMQMYVVLPVLFIVVTRFSSAFPVIAFWWSAAIVWLAVGICSGVYPLTDVNSPLGALLKATQMVPCFLSGVVAYKLWPCARYLPAYLWPIFLLLCCGAFILISGEEPVQAGWPLCFVIGVGVCFFRDLPRNAITRLASLTARYSYGIYVFHYLAIWVGFVALKRFAMPFQGAAFVVTLIICSVAGFHIIEAPMISVGVRLSNYVRAGRDSGWPGRLHPGSPKRRHHGPRSLCFAAIEKLRGNKRHFERTRALRSVLSEQLCVRSTWRQVTMDQVKSLPHNARGVPFGIFLQCLAPAMSACKQQVVETGTLMTSGDLPL